MAKNLKAFRKTGQIGQQNGTQANMRDANIGGEIDPSQRANIESMMNEYGGKSEAELMDELKRMTDNQKRSGSFDASAMQKTAESIMPMLTSEQQKKLIGIMNMLGK